MGLSLVLRKDDETPGYCVYVFGPPDAPDGRGRIRKSSGDIELEALPEGAPNGPFYLAHVVPRLQTYHEHDTYPDRDEWTP